MRQRIKNPYATASFAYKWQHKPLKINRYRTFCADEKSAGGSEHLHLRIMLFIL